MNTNTVKLCLIMLVIFDHNNISRIFFSEFLGGFSFHVVGFFALYHMRSSNNNYTELLSIQGFRYFYPYLIFVCSLSTAVYLTTSPDFFGHLLSTLRALYNGYFIDIKVSTNAYLLWFLPAFVSFVFLDKLYKDISGIFPKTAFLLLMLIFVLIPFIPIHVLKIMPLGLLTASYILFLVVITNNIYFNFVAKLNIKVRVIMVFLFFVAIKFIQINLGAVQEIGFLNVTRIIEILPFMVNMLEAIVGVMLIFSLSFISFGKYINLIGKYSLQIYLFHIFIAAGIHKIFQIMNLAETLFSLVITIILTVIISAIFSSFVMNNHWLSRFVFPKDYSSIFRRNLTKN